MHLPRAGHSARGHLLDLNLLPPAYRPSVFPLLGVALGLLAATGVLLLLAIYPMKAGADAEVAYLQADLQQTQRRLAELDQGTPAGEVLQSAVGLSKYKVGWSRVLQPIVASLPADARLREVSFAADPSRGSQAVVKGEAAEYAAVIEYADNLRSAPVFSRVTIQSMSQTAEQSVPLTETPAGGPFAIGLPSATPFGGAPFPASTRTPPTPQLVRPTSTPRPSSTPTATPFDYLEATATATDRATRTPTASANLDFIVLTKEESCDMSAPANASGDLVSGQVLDFGGGAMPGIRLRVASIHTSSPWSAETTTDGNGNFKFYLTKGNFQTEVLSGRSEVASELWTRSDQETGVCAWRVTFKKNHAGTPIVPVQPTPTITPTPTRTGTPTPWPTMTATPPPGTVIFGTASASNNSAQANLAIDNDLNTLWNAGGGYYQYWQEIFDTTYYVGGIGLVVSQEPAGNTTHIVRFYDAAEAEVAGSPVTFSGYTTDGQTLQHRFSTPLSGVRRVLVETTNSPSYVAWREVRVYAAGATATPTATPTNTPMATATPTAIGEIDDTWQEAKPIGIDQPKVLTFYTGADRDWLKFYTENTTPVVYSIRAAGDSSVHPVIELDEYVSSGIAFRGSSDADSYCPDRPNDAVLSQVLVTNTTYYIGLWDKYGASGTYTVTVHAGGVDCPTALDPFSLPVVAAAHGASEDAVTPSPANAIAAAAWLDNGGGRAPGLAAPALSLPAPPAANGPARAAQQVVSFTIVVDIKPEGGP